MSEVNTYPGPDLTTPHNCFAFVIDGEVVWKHMLYEELEQLTAIYGSNPTIVAIPKELGEQVVMGWKFDGESFSAE